jgi:hypothetical protein
VLGCGSTVLPGDRVELLTDNGNPPTPGCYTNSAEGQLMVDPRYGTTIVDSDVGATAPVPVMWRLGFTGRRAGSEVEVLDPAGNLVATTGRRYRIAGGYTGENPRLFWACDFVIEQ